MKFYVYMMTNKYNTVLYTGVTNNLARRVEEHKSGLNDGFTKKYNVNKLVYAETHKTAEEAIAREKQIKGLVRSKKEAIIESVNPEWDELEPF